MISKQKKNEKKEKKNLLKESKGQLSAKPIEKDGGKLLELQAAQLEKDVLSSKTEGSTPYDIVLEIDTAKPESSPKADSKSLKLKEIVQSKILTETAAKKSTKFSFRNTVMGLMSGFLMGGSGSKQQSEPELKTVESSKSSLHEEIVINIGLVGRQTKDDEEITIKEYDIPEIKVLRESDEAIEDVDDETNIDKSHKEKTKDKTKSSKSKHKISRMDAIAERNRLQIPEVIISDINVARDSKIKKESKEKKSKEKKKKITKLESKSSIKEAKKHDETKKESKVSKKKEKVLQKSKSSVKEKSEKLEKIEKKKLKKESDTKIKDKYEKPKKSKDLDHKHTKHRDKESKSRIKDQSPPPHPSHSKKVIVVDEPKDKKSSKSKLSKSKLLESIDETEIVPTKTSSSSFKLLKKVMEKDKSPRKEKIVERKKQMKIHSSHGDARDVDDDKRLIHKQSTISSSEIEIPVEHVYTDPTTFSQPIQIHHHHHQYHDQSTVPSTSMFTTQLPVEHVETVEKFAASSPTGDQHRKLIIEKTRNVMFDVGGGHYRIQSPQHSYSSSVVLQPDESTKSKKKKKVKLSETVAIAEPKDLKKDKKKDGKSSRRG